MYDYDANGRTLKRYSMTSVFREPEILLIRDISKYLPNLFTKSMRDDLNKELQKNFEETIKSIKTYGGFYIGRYETGGLSVQAKVVKENEDISSQNWYTMYKKSKTLNGTNRNVSTSMIWGCLWDATLEWMVDSGSKSYITISNSTTWGNYSNNTVTGHGSKRPTGYSEIWKSNNIYDMAGNVLEWTLEANSMDLRVSRGGDYKLKGDYYPVHCRINYYSNSANDFLRLQDPTLYRVALSPNSDT